MMRASSLLFLAYWGKAFGSSSAKFKRCEDSAFCTRYRSWKDRSERPTLSVVQVLEPKEMIDSGDLSVSMLLNSTAESKPNYSVELTFPGESGYMRVLIDDASNAANRTRYRIPTEDLAHREPRQPGSIRRHWEKSFQGGSTVISVPGEFRVEVVHAGFSIKVFNKHDELVQKVNSRNFFAFEKLRKTQGAKCLEGTLLDMSCNPQSDPQSMWWESFSGFMDAKRYGPSAVGLDIEFLNADGVFGLPEHTLPFNLPVFMESTSSKAEDFVPYEEIRFFNGDVFNHPLDSQAALYGAVPMLTAIHKSGAFASGMVWLNPSETYVALTRRGDAPGSVETTWVSESGVIDFLVFTGPSPKDVLAQYHDFTGKSPLPPSFALGYHQSKWGYHSESEVEQVEADFTRHEIPLDVLWLDIQHTEGNRYMTWNANYAHPQELSDKVGKNGRKLVAIVDPHIKKDLGYHVYQRGVENNAFIKSEDGNRDFEGDCWPGPSSYMDFTRSDVRSLWASLFKYGTYQGSSRNLYIWNDMNEPSVFNGPEMSLPRGALHANGTVEHRDIHNIYGQYFHRSTFEALLARDGPEMRRRPFVLSRAFFVGSHRYGPIWTGDNQASWGFLKVSVPMLLSLAISGQSFAGADVGGFEGDPSAELYVRWHQLGAMAYPFYRCHSTLNSRRREPWTFGPSVLEIVKSAIETRYMLLPYWYTAFAMHALESEPIIRPLWFDFMTDPKTVSETVATEEQIMVGNSILVRPVLTESTTAVDVYLPGPEESWYDFFDPEIAPIAGGQRRRVAVELARIPMYVRAGSILPIKLTKRRSVEQMKNDPISLRIFVKNNRASGLLYLDDEDSMSFWETGDFALIKLEFYEGTLTCEKIKGNRDIGELVIDKVEIFGDQTATKLRTSPDIKLQTEPAFFRGICRKIRVENIELANRYIA